MRFARFCGMTAAALLAGTITAQAQTTLTIATVNNDDMIEMQKLSPKFEQQTGIKLNWVIRTSWFGRSPRRIAKAG